MVLEVLLVMVRQETNLFHKHGWRVPGHLQHQSSCYSFLLWHFSRQKFNLEESSCQLGGDRLLEADDQHLLLPHHPSDDAKVLEELPHDDRPLPADGQVLRLDEDLVVAGEGQQVFEAHVEVDQAALHLHHHVVNALGDVLVVEEEQATCPLVIDEVEVDALDAQAGDAWRDIMINDLWRHL